MSNNVRLTWRERTLTLAQWAEELGLPRGALAHRVRRGWTVERTLTQPLRVCAR